MLRDRSSQERELSNLTSMDSARALKTLSEVREALRDHETAALTNTVATLFEITQMQQRMIEDLREIQPAEWMTARQAASYIQRSPSAFANIVAAGEIPKHYLTEKGILYNRREVDDWLMERTSPDDCL